MIYYTLKQTKLRALTIFKIPTAITVNLTHKNNYIKETIKSINPVQYTLYYYNYDISQSNTIKLRFFTY